MAVRLRTVWAAVAVYILLFALATLTSQAGAPKWITVAVLAGGLLALGAIGKRARPPSGEPHPIVPGSYVLHVTQSGDMASVRLASKAAVIQSIREMRSRERFELDIVLVLGAKGPFMRMVSGSLVDLQLLSSLERTGDAARLAFFDSDGSEYRAVREVAGGDARRGAEADDETLPVHVAMAALEEFIASDERPARLRYRAVR